MSLPRLASAAPLELPAALAVDPRYALVHVPGAIRAPGGAGSLRSWLACFARTLVVGFWANLVDFSVLAVCVRWLQLEALPARAIALVLSGVLSFAGNRSFAFRARGGDVQKQATRFVLAELVALPLNLLSFSLCTRVAPFAAPELVSFFANALVFVVFSYPVRRLLVFARS